MVVKRKFEVIMNTSTHELFSDYSKKKIQKIIQVNLLEKINRIFLIYEKTKK